MIRWYKAELPESKREAFLLCVNGRAVAVVSREPEYQNAWVICGLHSDGSRFIVISHHEMLPDVKAQAEEYV